MSKFLAFIASFFLGVFFMANGYLVIGLIFICLAILIPAA
jgi:hypothetical protein